MFGVRYLMRVLPAGAPLLGVIALANVVLGFAREGTVAYFFGATRQLDAFLIAQTIPRIVVQQSVAITVSVVLPLYISYRQRGEPGRATALVRAWFIFSSKVILGICAILALFAPTLVGWIGPGLSEHDALSATRWLRGLLPYVLALSITGTLKVVLEANRRFAIPAGAGGLLSLSVLGGCFIGAHRYGVVALVPAFVVAGGLTLIVHWIRMRDLEPNLLRGKPHAFRISLPVVGGGLMVIASAAEQFVVLVDRAFATTMDAGSVASLNYATAITAIPTTILTATIATALFPLMSEQLADGAHEHARRTAGKWILVVSTVCLPAVGALMVMRKPIVKLLFERGQFGVGATETTAGLMLVLPALIIVSVTSSILMRLLMAQRAYTFLALLSVAVLALKIALNFLLMPEFGLEGLVVATLATAIAATAARFIVAWRIPVATRRRTELLLP